MRQQQKESSGGYRMKTEEKARVISALMGIAEVFNEPMGDKRMVGYLAALEHLDENQILMAIRLHLKDSKFFPKPAELLDAARSNIRYFHKEKEIDGDLTTPEQREYCIEYAAKFKKRMGWL